jgi:hypothetical protein
MGDKYNRLCLAREQSLGYRCGHGWFLSKASRYLYYQSHNLSDRKGLVWGRASPAPEEPPSYIIFISFIIWPQPSHVIIIDFMDIGPIFIS